jgi:putative ABC transport system substrate-binding protein
MGQQAGQMVVKVLKGKDPGVLPIEEAFRYALAFNLKRARQLNIDIPNEILLAADEVIQ